MAILACSSLRAGWECKRRSEKQANVRVSNQNLRRHDATYWKSPGHWIRVRKVHAKIDPVGYHDAASDKSSFNHDQHSSSVSSRALGLPSGYRGCVQTVAEARDKTTDDELSELK